METLKKQSQQAWGLLSHFDAVDAILQACRQLETNGDKISREKVKLLSGVGYTNLLAAGIALYKARKELTDRFPKSPDIVVHTLCTALENALQDFSKQADQRIQQEKEAFVTALEAAAHEHQTLEAQCGQLQADLDLQSEQTRSLSHQLSESKKAILQVEEQKTQLNEKYLDALQAKEEMCQSLNQCQRQMSEQAEQKKYEQEQLKQLWQEEKLTLLEQHDKAMDQMMVKWGNEKADWTKEKKALSKNGTELSSQLNDTQKENTELARKISEHKHIIGSMQKSLAEAKTHLKEQLEKLTTNETKYEAEINKYQTALQQKEEQLNRLLIGLEKNQGRVASRVNHHESGMNI